MKTTYYEIIWKKHAFSRKMRCPACKNKTYEIVHIAGSRSIWFVRCPICGAESLESPTKEIAVGRWKQL